MTITPLRDLVLVELEDAPEAPLASGLVVVRAQREPSCYAAVRAIGPEVRDATIGQRCIVSRLQGIEIAGRVLLPEAAILATLSSEVSTTPAPTPTGQGPKE